MSLPILSTLVYCLKDRRVLMMQRRKEPNLGLWVAPGGKIEIGESPYECAARELAEETGLAATSLIFRGLITEVSPQPDWQWMLFLYVATSFSGDVGESHREGALQWWSVSQVPQLPIPQGDRIFYPRIIDLEKPFFDARFVYDGKLDLVQVIENGR
ncbi:MAG TPA: 8-oxo-dGTP diphosphatase [Anaerolineae bacterium]